MNTSAVTVDTDGQENNAICAVLNGKIKLYYFKEKTDTSNLHIKNTPRSFTVTRRNIDMTICVTNTDKKAYSGKEKI